MTNGELFALGALGATVGLWLYSRTDSGAAVIADTTATIGDTVATVTEKIVSGVRGIRNNNPGNIRLSGDKWQGLSPAQTDGAFFQFQTMEYGIRALVKILRKYQDSYGLDTVRGIVNRWAPPVENNTGAYVSAVAESVGVDPAAHIDTHDTQTAFLLARAIIAHENGRIPALLISDDSVYTGVEMA